MPTYIYKAKKGPTEIVTGEIEANSQDSASGKLIEMGLFPVSVEEKQKTEENVIASLATEGGGAKPALPAGRQSQKETASSLSLLAMTSIKVRARDIDTFTRQLSSLVRANVPMLRALSLISQQTESVALRNVVSDLEKQVKEGKMLSEAMGNYPKIFNNLYLSIVKAGEKSGALDEVLCTLAEHREKEQEIRQKIQAAIAYPILLVILGFGTIFTVLTYFLPKLMGLFANMKQTLPLPTKILIGLSKFMSNNWYWFLIALIFLAAIFGRIKQGSKKKFLFDIIKLRLPFINKFVRDSEIAKFAGTLSLLLKNGIPVHESLELATNTLDNEALKESLEQLNREIINQGSTLSNSFNKIDIFPKFAVNMIAVGEEGGKLEEVLKEVASVYEKEVEQAIKILTSLIEPVLILVIGAIIGFIVFAMLLPIFNMGNMPT